MSTAMGQVTLPRTWAQVLRLYVRRAELSWNLSEPRFPVVSTEDHVSATQVVVKSKDYIRKETSAPWVLCTVPGTNSSGCPMTSACSSTSESPLPVS